MADMRIAGSGVAGASDYFPPRQPGGTGTAATGAAGSLPRVEPGRTAAAVPDQAAALCLPHTSVKMRLMACASTPLRWL